jgi:hypothetical protein
VIPGDPNVQRVEVVAAAAPSLKSHLALRLSALVGDAGFQNALPGLIAQDALREQRVAEVRSRIEAIAKLKMA